MVWRWWLLPCVLAAGCADAADSLAGESYMDDDLPPWSCMDESAGSSSGACESSGGLAAPACSGSADCSDEGVCVAHFDGDIGSFRCEAVCVPNDDQTSWCFDAAACCEANASCVRGLCIPAADGTGETSTSGDASSSGVDGSSSGDASSGSSA